MGRIHALVLVVAAVFAAACSKSEPAPKVTYGEPVGVRMEASEGVPAFDMALAVTEGADVGALVAPVSKAVRDALLACPAAMARGAKGEGEGAEVAFTIEGGKASLPTPAEGEAGCFSRAFVDLPIASPRNVGVLVQIRFTAAEKSAPSASP